MEFQIKKKTVKFCKSQENQEEQRNMKDQIFQFFTNRATFFTLTFHKYRTLNPKEKKKKYYKIKEKDIPCRHSIVNTPIPKSKTRKRTEKPQDKQQIPNQANTI
jgi:hypothetical protein